MKILSLLICIFLSNSYARNPISGNRYQLLSGIRQQKENRSFGENKPESDEYVYGKAPAKFLARNYPFLPTGAKVLDISMGEGRNAVFLARKGYKVIGIDTNSVAVRKARRLAREFGVQIETSVNPVDKFSVPKGSLDAIISFYYVDKKIIKKMKSWLKPGGIIIFEAYTQKQLELNLSVKYDHYSFVKEEQLLKYFGDMKILKFEEPLHTTEFTSSIIVQKK